MKKINFILLFLTISFNVLAQTPSINLQQLQKDIISYHESGEYNYFICQQEKNVKRELANYIIKNENLSHPQKLALVLDIDETSLSNYKYAKKVLFNPSLKQIKDTQAKADLPAISCTLQLYNFALKNNVDVFFITGRKESSRTTTIKNLKLAGYTKFKALYMLPDDKTYSSNEEFKINMRHKIIDQNYLIVLNIGDQNSDFAPQSNYEALYDLNLPNYMYIVT